MQPALLISVILIGSIPNALAVPTVDIPRAINIDDLGKALTADNHYGSPIPPWQASAKPGWYYGPNPEKAPGVPCLTPDTCKGLDNYPHAIHCPHSYPPPRPPHYPPPHYPPPPPHYPPPHYPPPHYPPPPPTHTTKPHTPPHTTKTTTKYTTKPTTKSTTRSTTKYTTKPTTKSSTRSTTKSTSTTYTSPTPTYTPPPSDGYHPTFYNISAAVQADDYMTFGLVETVSDCKAMCDKVAGCDFVNTYHDVHGKGGSPLLTCALFKLCHGAEDADNRGGQSQPDGTINFIADSYGWCKD